jgi:Uma2 family endonuclease
MPGEVHHYGGVKGITMDSQPIYDEWRSDPLKQEKINGVFYNMAAGTSKHAGVIAKLFGLIFVYLRDKKCRPYTSELDVYLDEDNSFRPDISVICDFTKLHDDGYHGAPTLVVEALSPSTAKRDRGAKFAAYQAAGVKELWFVVPEYETIEQYALQDGAFKLLAIHWNADTKPSDTDDTPLGTTFASSALEGLAINLSEVFDFQVSES